ncbi:MAG: diphthine--ammonia ligase [Candidatus Bathyarchaeia archaeon]
MNYIASWSGGKDSCFACYKAICDGLNVSYLVNFISKEYRRVSFHGTEARLIQLQAEAVGIPLLQKETTWNGYEQEFKESVKSLIPNGIRGMIFGDIYLQEHKDWVERVCEELGIEAIEPLWGKEPEKILLDFIDEGFEAIIVSARSDLLGKEWIGRKVDREFLGYLKENNIDVCGENGEYHTFVIDGPLFKKKIKIIDSRAVMRNDRWFLDTLKYSLLVSA